MTDNLAGLSAEEKRVLLARLLMEKAEESASAYPLSHGQRSLWFLYQLAPGSPAYTITYAGRIRGRLNDAALEAAAQGLVDRHEILRTTYTTRDGQPVQLVHPRLPVRVNRLDLSADETQRWLRREADRPFDLRTGPVVRFNLITQGPDEHLLVLTLHHIAVDMWSIDLILDELRQLYAAEHGAPTPPLPPMRYVDYADQHTHAIEGADGERLWRYWSRQLAGETPMLRLPIDRPRGAVQTYRGAVHRFSIDPALTARLKDVGRSAGATPYMTLFAAYATLLHRYSGQDDLLIGSPFGCRDHAGLASVVGYIANPVVLRPDLGGNPTFTSLLGRVKTTVLEALEHQDFPFALLVEKLDPARDLSHTPLFQVSFAWEQTRRFQEGAASAPGTLDFTTAHIGQGGAPLDLMLLMGEQDGELLCALQYNTDLFDDTTIERMAEHFTTLLGGIVTDPDASLSTLPIGTEAERTRQQEWNDTATPFDAPDTLPAMVTAAARANPSEIAVTFGDRDLTYADLDRRTDDVASRLQTLGVGPDSVVTVLLDRSEDLVVALLAVAKSGAAFMPLDPGQPANRIAAMIEAAGTPVVVTHERNLKLLNDFSGQRLCLDLLATPSETFAPRSAARPNGLAYVVHTSGSTGVPKRVLNTHRGLRNLLLWMRANYKVDARDRVLHHTPVTFDASLAEIFLPLIVGARLVIAKPDGHRDAAYLVRTIAEHSITQIVHVVPSMLQSWLAEPGLRDCVALRRVTCGGEALPYDLAQRFLNTTDAELWNEYGPAESAVTATYAHCKRGAPGPSIPIGRPMANVQIHLLDGYLQPVPVGVPGELYIGGAGVGRGYSGQPGQTSTRFIADPFAASPGGMLYRTGDLARYAADGNIEYLGRQDSQVEIRGVRIEPGEVEVALARHPDVTEAVVVAGADERGHTQLTAHIASTAVPTPSIQQLRRFLLEWLPAAMLPAHFVVTNELPRTSGGKVDRRVLAETSTGAAERAREFVAARNHTEEVLVGIWCKVLGVERVGVHDDFFALGGSSTHSLEVAVRAESAGLPLKPESVFLFGTIAELAEEYGGEPLDSSPAETVLIEPEEIRPQAEPRVLPAPQRPARNTVIESIGTYLPFKEVSTADMLAGCVNDIGIPLEKLTGIKHRRVAAEGEFSIDLARQAIADCLSRSSYRPVEIDLLISCSISRYDGPDQKFVFEPSTAARLRDQCGLDNALAFDITNACAGMFTGIAIADAFLQNGLIGRAMVVSGEYITHISETAQRQIEGPMDPRLACLTVGDAGAAVILERGPNNRAGFHDIDIATLSRYAPMCIAKATGGPEGGAIMTVDSIAATAIAVKAAVPYVAGVMRRHGWRPEHSDHIVMHQTSESSLNDAVGAVNRMFGEGSANPGNTIYNLAERGNTASTTHFVALKDHILSNRIRSGDNAVFGISASGQTVGAALYTFDDLPDRLRRGSEDHRRGAMHDPPAVEPPQPPAVGIAGIGTIPTGAPGSRGSVELATQAAAQCLDHIALDRNELGLIIHAGVYRDEFISEPAIAALVAGELGVNDDIRSPDGPKTLAFDVFNGAVGFLNACQVAVQMIGAGKTGHAMVVASETENNDGSTAHPSYGLSETGSAVVLSPTDGNTGFGRFVFRQYPEHAGALTTYTRHSDDRTWLEIERDPDLDAHYVAIIADAVGELLKLEAIAPSDIAAVFPPHLSQPHREELASRLGIASSLFVDPVSDTDPFSSSVPHGLQHAWQHGLVRSGDVGLIVSVGSGLQVGCATYRF
ncbi:amino acid adenylation domain-containing protein [Candidatus Mycobacterium wuenschmannii]|uniref:Amino acid adenylation domain-containing protein n=1 Tax=Candidatus Mycobacterium wuenschmannii TaxID=3027808 RepID=A0ABY8VX58_9MYCO|nr:non-ribosomal peptide synthetase [Candidatus Mycobacterium wuenschmannii]WIM86737.1 amino acid adenylation domain-containing protein [Candidatus Mycobacterium wuenschmannii]